MGRITGATVAILSFGLTVNPAFAQANGDPGAAMQGQLAAQKANKNDKKSGANAMSKGASGGAGDPSVKGGSNSMSGSGEGSSGSKP